MKKGDYGLLILIVSLSLVISFIGVKALFGEPKNSSTKVEVAESISPTITEPSSDIFNKDAINPTVVIQIGTAASEQPFTGQ